jgi:uncharacterized membrane protein
MHATIILLVLIATILVALDYTYMFFNKSMFVDQIVQIQRTALVGKPEGFVFCYIFIVLGLYYFIIRQHRPPFEAFLLGLFVYGIFELTNYSLFKKWSINMVIMDTLWGGVLFFITTFLVYKAEKWIKL